MICKYCSSKIPEDAAACPNCGAPRPGSEDPDPDKGSSPAESPAGEPSAEESPAEEPSPSESPDRPLESPYAYAPPARAAAPLPMKWHAFLCYAALWVIALISLYRGFTNLFGSGQGADGAQFYRMFPLMRHIDAAFGIVSLAVAVLAVLSAVFLIKKRKKGPVLLIVTLALLVVYKLLFELLSIAVAAETPAKYAQIVRLAFVCCAYALLIVLNVIYYKKRKTVFV